MATVEQVQRDPSMEVPAAVDVKADSKEASQSGAEGEMSWQNQLRHECAVMLVYAFASGLNVPESVSQAIAEAEVQLPAEAVKLPQTLANDRDTGSGGAGSANAPQNGLDNRIRLPSSSLRTSVSRRRTKWLSRSWRCLEASRPPSSTGSWSTCAIRSWL